MPKLPTVTLAVRNAGIYKAPRNLPNLNQPDVLNVENYLGSPFYAYMFVTNEKKREAIRDEEVQELLSSSENLNFYIQKMSYDLKLQKVSMGSILLKNTYVHIKNMRKFIWQHNNPEKVIVKNREDYLPGFKRILTRFILLNYCAMNTPELSGADWHPENTKGQAFNTINRQYQTEFKNFEWKGENCRLRHPNPLGGSPKVNFSAFTDDMSDGRVFFLDVYKTGLQDAINIANSQIFELLSKYLGSLSILPSDKDLASSNLEIEMDTPSVFEIMEAKEVRPTPIVYAEPSRIDIEKRAKRLAAEERATEQEDIISSGMEEVSAGKLTKEAQAAAKAAHKQRIERLKPQARKQVIQESEPIGESPEFVEQVQKIEDASVRAFGNDIMTILHDEGDINAVAEALNNQLGHYRSDINILAPAVQALTEELLRRGLYNDEGRAVDVAKQIIFKGLEGKDFSKKPRGLIGFNKLKEGKDFELSGNSGFKKGGFRKLVNAILSEVSKKRSQKDFSKIYAMI